MKRRKGYYSISVVAQMFDVHQQTIRLYEKEGLIAPKRTEGGTRMFSEEDVDRLEEIIYLTHKMGVNIAGVEMILKLQRKIKKLQDEMNGLFNKTQETLREEENSLKESLQKSAAHLSTLKNSNKEITSTPRLSTRKQEEKKQVEEWSIEYNDDHP